LIANYLLESLLTTFYIIFLSNHTFVVHSIGPVKGCSDFWKLFKQHGNLVLSMSCMYFVVL